MKPITCRDIARAESISRGSIISKTIYKPTKKMRIITNSHLTKKRVQLNILKTKRKPAHIIGRSTSKWEKKTPANLPGRRLGQAREGQWFSFHHFAPLFYLFIYYYYYFFWIRYNLVRDHQMVQPTGLTLVSLGFVISCIYLGPLNWAVCYIRHWLIWKHCWYIINKLKLVRNGSY